jgi:lipid-A-disaccharide synthase
LGTDCIMLAAGEASGDRHAAAVAQELLRHQPGMHLFGMGSTRLRDAGVELLVDAAPLAVVGLSEVIVHYPALLRALRMLRRALALRRPKLLILVDNPDFNLRLAKTARSLGIPVLYFISPQVWAWRRGRIKTIAKRVDHMAVAFGFEESMYRQAGVAATFVGHPLLDDLPDSMDRKAARASLDLPPDGTVIGLFPGSRKSELRRLAPILAETAKRVKASHPQARFLLPVAPALGLSEIRKSLGERIPEITLVQAKDIYESIAACDVIAAASGTVTLQIALMGVPMAIFYRVSPFSYAIAKRLVRIAHIGLPNIVAGKRLVAEFVQDEADPEAISQEILRLLKDAPAHQAVRKELLGLRSKLGSGGAATRVAALALGMLRP